MAESSTPDQRPAASRLGFRDLAIQRRRAMRGDGEALGDDQATRKSGNFGVSSVMTSLAKSGSLEQSKRRIRAMHSPASANPIFPDEAEVSNIQATSHLPTREAPGPEWGPYLSAQLKALELR
jgi:hypothetical protein